MSKQLINEAHILDNLKEVIGKAKKKISSQKEASDFVSKIFNIIKDLPHKTKVKIAKYVIFSFIGILGITLAVNLIPKDLEEIKPEIAQIESVYQYPTKSTPQLKEFLKIEEGRAGSNGEAVLKAYDIGDGMITIGWGHATEIKASLFRVGDKITLQQAEDFLTKDIENAEDGLNRILIAWEEQEIIVPIDQNMYDAMASMIYNMGIGNFRTSEFIQLVKQDKMDEAQEKIKSTYITYSGHKPRRENESNMFGKTKKEHGERKAKVKEKIRKYVQESLSVLK